MNSLAISAPLDARATYRSPSGRLCHWVPLGGPGGRLTTRAYFEYVDRTAGCKSFENGFTLTPANYHVLQRVPP